MKTSSTYLAAIVACSTVVEAVEYKTFSAYVWGQVFDPDTCHSDAYVTSRDDANSDCFHGPYDTAEQRAQLFNNLYHGLDGREVKKIFLDTTGKVKNIGGVGVRGCDHALMTTIAEAHQRGLKVYALYGAECPDLCERNLVRDVVDYNNLCSSINRFNDVIKFDGVAINNEFLTTASSCEPGASTEYAGIERNNVDVWHAIVDGLNEAKVNAQGLPLHFSLGWWWGECEGGGDRQITRGAETKKVTDFILDIVDSIDVQVAWMNDAEEMVRRAGYYYNDWFQSHDYDPEDPSFTVTVYTNPVASDECQTSFAPHHLGAAAPSVRCEWCNNGAHCDRTQAGMFARFDELGDGSSGTGLEFAHGGFNYYGGVFGTGITPDWPDNFVYHYPGDACSRDEDCRFSSDCVETGDEYGWKVCKGLLIDWQPEPIDVCLPAGIQCMHDNECCGGLTCRGGVPSNCDSYPWHLCCRHPKLCSGKCAKMEEEEKKKSSDDDKKKLDTHDGGKRNLRY